MILMFNFFLYIVVFQVIVGLQKYLQVYDVFEKVVVVKLVLLIFVFRLLINCKIGILFICSGYFF